MRKSRLASAVLAGFILSSSLSAPAMAKDKSYDLLDAVELSNHTGIESNEKTESAIDYIKTYVKSSFALEDTERQAEILRRKAERDKRSSISKNFQWQSKHTEAGLAQIDAVSKTKSSRNWARDVYKYGGFPDQEESQEMVTDLMLNPKEAEGKLGSYSQMTKNSSDKKNRLEASKAREKEADALQTDASDSKEKAEKIAVESVSTTEESKEKTQQISTDTLIKEQQYKDASVEFNSISIDDDKASDLTISQRAINQAIVDRWNDYLESLDEADIDIPTLDDLEGKDFYKDNEDLTPYLDLDGKPTKNVAALKDNPSTYVLPQETIKQVSTQLREVGESYNKKGTGKKDKWSCSAFVSQSYGDDRKVSLDDMWNDSGEVDSLDKLPGDTVFIGSSESGLHHAGTYIGGGMIVASSMPSKSVGIENTGANYFGVKRNTIPAQDKQTKAPKKTDDAVDWECGGIVGGALEGDWLSPVAESTYEFGDEFGEEDKKRWGDEKKTSPGLEFVLNEDSNDDSKAAKEHEEAHGHESDDDDTPKDSKESQAVDKSDPNADPNADPKADEDEKKDEKDTLKKGVVRASGSGIVEITKGNKDWGNMITIAHKDKIKTIYTHLDKTTVDNGAKVNKGDAIGTVGSTGKKAVKKSDPLMFIMEKEGKRVDPKPFLFPSSAGSYSGNLNKVPENFSTDYDNGKLPESITCPILDGGHKIRCEAVPAFIALNAAYKGAFGQDICITDSYRSYEAQVDVKRRKPGLAAVPGTSNHGWGLAMDLCGGIQTFGTPQHEWMSKNAQRFGWFHPDWAKANGSKPEAWHFESILSKKE